MTEDFEDIRDEGEENFSDAFSEMDNALSGVPEGEFITLRNGANRPVYVPLFEGETGISIAQAVGRAGLTVGVVELPRFSGHMEACGMRGTSMQGFVPVG